MFNCVSVSKELKQLCPNIRLGVIQATIDYREKNDLLWQEIDQVAHQIRSTYQLEQIVHLPVIDHTRKAYLSLGKEPARYRCSAESLLRRVIQGKDLYQINNVVDIINLISLSYHFSIGCYDSKQLVAPVIFDIGNQGETYQAIGRGMINIENLPVFRDKIGPFGSPTSDSVRSMVTKETKEIIIIIIDFSGKDPLEESLDRTYSCLEMFAGAKMIEKQIVH